VILLIWTVQLYPYSQNHSHFTCLNIILHTTTTGANKISLLNLHNNLFNNQHNLLSKWANFHNTSISIRGHQSWNRRRQHIKLLLIHISQLILTSKKIFLSRSISLSAIPHSLSILSLCRRGARKRIIKCKLHIENTSRIRWSSSPRTRSKTTRTSGQAKRVSSTTSIRLAPSGKCPSKSKYRIRKSSWGTNYSEKSIFTVSPFEYLICLYFN